MSKEESLASYHFWKHQYVSRNKEYGRYDEIKSEVRQIFEKESGDLAGVWHSLLETPDVDDFLNNHGLKLSVIARQQINKARDIEVVIMDRFSMHTAHYEDSSSLLDLAMTDELDSYIHNQALHFPSIGELVSPYSSFQNDTPFMDVRINALGNIEVILEEVRTLYSIKRKQLSESLSRKELDDEYADLHNPDMLMDSIQQANPSVPAKKFPNTPRVIGLWLWDAVQQTGIDNIAHHERAFKEIKSIDRTGYEDSDYRVFSRLYQLTQMCIKKAEVIKV